MPRRRETTLVPEPSAKTVAPQTPEEPHATADPSSPVVSGVVATAMTPKVAWPARPAAAPGVLCQGNSAFSKGDVTTPSDHGPDVGQSPPDELERGKIVVHYADGRIKKGYSYDFYPNKPCFYLLPLVAGFSFSDERVKVPMEDLKAVFFVRDFVGDSSYNERKYFAEGERPPGRKVEVRFKDGEVLVGSTVGYDRQRPGFFLIPADLKSNNLKVFAVSAAVTQVRFV